MDYKAPGGKLVRINATIDPDKQIRNIEITGDFFLLPEDGLPKLERLLIGTMLEEDTIRNVVDRFYAETETQSLGVTRDDFVSAILSMGETGK